MDSTKEDKVNYATLYRFVITDKTGIGKLKLIGTFNREILDKSTIKRSDGFYCQFVLDIERVEPIDFTGKEVGIDLGLNHFLTEL